MLDMNNIRFSYEEKNQYFGGQEAEGRSKTGIGKLLSKYERSKAADDDEESQVAKKKVVYHGNSLNYSQIYSDIRINRNDKILPATDKKEAAPFEHAGISRAESTQINPNLTYIPKSLPKIARNSRLINRTEQQRWDKDPSFVQNATEEDRSRPRGKAFSISHYDIYKPNQERGSAFASSKFEERSRDLRSEKNNSFVSSAYNQEVDEESALRVKFEEAERDLPEQNDSHVEVSQNTISRKEFKIQPEQSDISLKHLEKEEIKIQNKLPGLPKKQSYREKQKDAQAKMEQKLKEQNRSIREETIEQKKSKDVTELQPSAEEPSKSRVKFIESRKSSAKSTLKPKQQTQQIKTVKQQIEQNKVVPANNYVEEKQKKIEPQAAPAAQIKRRPSQSLTQPVPTTQIKRQPSQSVSRVSRASSEIKPQFVKREPSVKQQPQARKEESRKKIEVEAPEIEVRVKEVEKQGQKKESKQQIQEHRQQAAKQVRVVEQSLVQIRKFDVEEYIKVYEILKVIQGALKAPQIDTHTLVKQIKKYLQIVAGGGLDHVQGYDMPLHRLKIIKNALLYERIALVIISFSYAIGKMKQSLKYLINLIVYSTNNTLLILKLLESCEMNKQVNKNPIMAKSERLVLKRNFDTVRNNSDIILDSIFKISKNDEAFYQSFKDILKSIGKNSLEQTFYNVLEYFAFFLCVSDLHMAIPFLAVAPNPYLRETIDKRPTLVIDIVEIFCHGTRKSKSHVFRPHTEHFLNEMSQYYEIVSFTCAYPNQIDKVIDILDPKRHIKHRLYRHHALMLNSAFYKDTERIGRDLNRLILLDSDINVIAGEINNTIMIPSWRGNKNDTTLAELCPILAAISIKHLDCREATRRIHEQQQKNESAGIKYLNFGINLQ